MIKSLFGIDRTDFINHIIYIFDLTSSQIPYFLHDKILNNVDNNNDSFSSIFLSKLQHENVNVIKVDGGNE